MDAEATQRYIREENEAAERLVARVRVAVLVAMLALQLGLTVTGVANSRSTIAGLGTIGFGLVYGLGLWWVLRRGYNPAIPYVSTALDTALVLTNAVAASTQIVDSTKAPAILILFMIVAVAGLRQSPRLPVFAGGIAAAAYIALLGAVALVEPARIVNDVRFDFRGPDVAPVRVATVAVLLLITAGITAVTARRARNLVARAVEASVRRQALLSAFERYFPEREALQMIVEGRELEAGGRRRTVTVLVSDIRGFTTISEGLAPDAVVALLNQYFEAMAEVVFDEEGTLMSFVGDGLYAVFGLPEARPDDAERAYRTALHMLEHVKELNEAGVFEAVGGLRIGIALHTGEVLAGSIGSSRRLEYTVIGDTVNTAARLEELNKRWHTELVISEATAAAVGRLDGMVDRGRLELRGRGQSLGVYTLEERGARVESLA